MEAQLTVAKRSKKNGGAGHGKSASLERRVDELEDLQDEAFNRTSALEQGYNSLVDHIPVIMENYYARGRAQSFVFGAPGSSFVFADVCTPLKSGLPIYALKRESNGELKIRRVIPPQQKNENDFVQHKGVFIPHGCYIKIGAEGVIYRTHHHLHGDKFLVLSFASCSLISIDTSDSNFTPPMVKNYAVPLYSQVVVRRTDDQGNASTTLSTRHETLWHVNMAESSFVLPNTSLGHPISPRVCFRISQAVTDFLTAEELVGPYEEFKSRLGLTTERDILRLMLSSLAQEEMEDEVDEEIDLSKLKRHTTIKSSYSSYSTSSGYDNAKISSLRFGNVDVTEHDIGVIATFTTWVLGAAGSIISTVLRRSKPLNDNQNSVKK